VPHTRLSRKWAFPAICAIAGALAVPLHPVTTILSAGIAGVTGVLGLRVWRWSRLPQPIRRENRRAFWWAGLGLVVGLLLLAVMRLIIEPILPSIGARIAIAGTLPIWRRVLIIYVAAVGEELVFRLLLLSFIAGVLVRFRRSTTEPTRTDVWTANALSALAFGAVHLPAWSGTANTGITLAVAVVTLNLLGALVLGYVFATRGIVAAIWTHAGADCAIQLIGPLTS
jgi:membrane protease YdiL (CAAX protease family)